MSSNPQRLEYLFQQYLTNVATSDELKEFWKLFNELDEEDTPVKEDLWKLWYNLDDNDRTEKKDWEKTHYQINLQKNNWNKKRFSISIRRVAAAASIIITLGIGAYFLLSNKPSRQLAKNEIKTGLIKNDILPGNNKAILTLSNGRKIPLDNAPLGMLAQQGNTKIIKQKNGQLAYNNIDQSSEHLIAAVQFNTLTTPRGGQYKIKLPDGSEVWLNSASSLKYPTAFSGNERRVEITGEAYFEITHNADKPFKVIVNGSQVEVLGTHFNINAYNDEPVMRTTLLEGSIRFSNRNNVRVLLPGQQIQVTSKGAIKSIKDVDPGQTIAWTNGLFSFQNTSIYEVMRQISRWYDVDVSFQDSPQVFLNGTIKRDVNVSQVFQMIELTGEVKFKTEGRKITVMK